METASVARRIADIAASQWGMITTAQARGNGVARANLVHRIRTGELERTDHYGVYRLVAAPTSPLDDLRAAWLSTNPEVVAPERTAMLRPDAVIASAAAAMVHDIGDVHPAPYRIIVPGRRQNATGSIAYSWRALDSRDVEVVDGLPVTTRERTLVDLLEDEGDVSIVADALRDAWRSEYDLNEKRLAELLASNAVRLGQDPGDGVGALAYLMVTAEVDVVSQARRALDQVLVSQVPLPVISSLLSTLASNMPTLSATSPPMAPDLAGRTLQAEEDGQSATGSRHVCEDGAMNERVAKPSLLFTISRSFGFSASHQLRGLRPDHKCGRLHGHTYTVVLELRGILDEVGFVVDFGELDWLSDLLADRLDHQHLNDILDINPTSENIAGWIADHVRDWLLRDVRENVTGFGLAVSESPRSSAHLWIDTK